MPKLFIPGPTWVRPDVFAAMSQPMIGHRSPEYAELQARVTASCQRLMQTQGDVFFSTSSATGLMEGAIRSCVQSKSLHFVNGAFSRRWYELAESCGKSPALIEVSPGEAITPELVLRAVEREQPEAICLTHCETATGVLSPVGEIATAVRQQYPDVLIMVDTVSSLGGVDVQTDNWDLDVCLASVQKCLALPPGFSMVAVSARALEKAKSVTGRGMYLDFLTMQKFAHKNNTLMTPSIPHLYALDYQLDQILNQEGLHKRFERHLRMQAMTREWAEGLGLTYLSAPEYASPTISCLRNRHDWDIKDIIRRLKTEYDKEIANGYGELKGQTFRIGHLGDHSEDDLAELLDQLTSVISN